jgi:hypothetical protein
MAYACSQAKPSYFQKYSVPVSPSVNFSALPKAAPVACEETSEMKNYLSDL